MSLTCEPRRAGGAAGPLETFRLAMERLDNANTTPPAQSQNRAVREARLKLLREAIFEDLGAAKLVIETALLLIEARDDVGARHSIRMGALHFKAAEERRNAEARAYRETKAPGNGAADHAKLQGGFDGFDSWTMSYCDFFVVYIEYCGTNDVEI